MQSCGSKLMIMFLTSLLLTSCGAEPTQQASQTESFASWSNQVGGSLTLWSPGNLADVKEVKFYRVRRPVGLGIVHIFVGVRVTTQDGRERLLTTALVGEGDDAYYRSVANQAEFAELRATFKDAAARAAIRRVNRYLVDSPYHNHAYYASAMTLTPLFGRPCARVSRQVLALL